MVPVGDAGKDDALEVREDGVEVFAVLGGPCREGVADVAGTHAREDREALGVLEVVRDPVGEAVSLLAKILQWNPIQITRASRP